MKSVLISIQPKWCDLIAIGQKTIEVRKNKPKLATPFKVYIYETNWKNNTYWANKHKGKMGKVIGEFVCDRITTLSWMTNPSKLDWADTYDANTCLTNREIYEYSKGDKYCEWHISDLEIYDEPRELTEFFTEGDCVSGNCKKCMWFDGGNGYNVEADCLLPYNFVFKKAVKPLFRPPQSWCYVEEEEQ
jgi:predicted transcriptional regulator